MRIAFLGAGPAGSAMAALAASRGHEVTLFSPRGGGTRHLGHDIATTGLLEGRFPLRVAADLWRATERAEAILLALPPAALPPLLQRLASALVGSPAILFAPASGLAPALLHQWTLARGLSPRIAALPVPPLLATRNAEGVVEVTALRPRLWLGPLADASRVELAGLTESLFGLPVEPLADVLAASLAEPGALMEAARLFAPAGLTHGIGRLLLALAAERDALGAALGRDNLPGIAALVTEQGGIAIAPRPFDETGQSIAFLEAMARATGTPAPLVTAALNLLETAAGERFGPHPVLAALEAGPLEKLLKK